MKKVTTLIAGFTLIALSACGDKNQSDVPNSTAAKNTNSAPAATNSASSLTADIDGTNFAAGEFFDKASSKFNITIVGAGADKKRAVILFFDRAKIVTGAVFNYKFKGETVRDSSVTLRKYTNFEKFEFDDYAFGSSTITITKAAPDRIEGTFTASGKDHNITAGKFSVATQLAW